MNVAILALSVVALTSIPALGQPCGTWTLRRDFGCSPRYGHAMAYDSARGRVVLFGGYGPREVPLSDTWEWDGSYWTLKAVDGPEGRRFHAMAFDSARGRTVMYGGDVPTEQTWEWDGAAWVLRATAGPSPRNNLAMAYDVERNRLVLYGGGTNGPDGPIAADTWEWDGVAGAWNRVFPATNPGPRLNHAMAYDGARVLLYGGTCRDDTWAWDGSEWTQLASVGPDLCNALGVMAFDGARGRAVLYGGERRHTLNRETWEWDGTVWRLRATNAPPARYYHGTAFDSLRGRIVVFGGVGDSPSTGDTWEFVVVRPPCPPDWDRSGCVDSQDFFDLLAAFFAGESDFNGDGPTNSQDFFDFLAAFFVGCG